MKDLFPAILRSQSRDMRQE